MENGTITRRMESAFNGLQEELRALCPRRDFEAKLMDLQDAVGSERPSKLKALYHMFDICGIRYEPRMSSRYYAELIENAPLLTYEEVEDRLLRELFLLYRDYPSPETYMNRLVDRLCDERDGWGGEPLRLRILKQFIKYGNYLFDADIKGRKVIFDYVKEKRGSQRTPSAEQVLKTVDDGVFAALELGQGLDADDRKDAKKRVELLRICDDLASGSFRIEGRTKKSLYLFAMVYGMTYFSGGSEGGFVVDPRRDIEKNLFQDYYINNLMRFLTADHQENLCGFDLDPSGAGINYKNYAEMVYLYYLTKELPPQEKVRGSFEMIKRIPAEQQRRMEAGELMREDAAGTAVYREWFRRGTEDLFSEDILSLPEEAFVSFLCEHYNCDTRVGRAEIGKLQLETEQNSAFGQYEQILSGLIRELRLRDGEDREWQNKCSYGLWFTDAAVFGRDGGEEKRRALLERVESMVPPEKKALLTEGAMDDFIALLRAVDRFMGSRAFLVTSSKDVTRTAMVVAYYYYYNALHENRGGERWKTFEEVFREFAGGLDPYLEGAYYQKLSGRNIFDVLVVFSAYAYLHDQMF